MLITRAELANINFSAAELKYVNTDIEWSAVRGECGNEHYRLLAQLSSMYKGRDIFDIGTHRGASALALAWNPENMVYSFDIMHNYRLPVIDNVRYVLEDLWDWNVRSRWQSKILNSAFIFLDIDPHEGTREFEFYMWLKSVNYKGFVVCDDIWFFENMRERFWKKIPLEDKINITHMGHWSGTGVIRFHNSETKFDANTSIEVSHNLN